VSGGEDKVGIRKGKEDPRSNLMRVQSLREGDGGRGIHVRDM
jgi:hypothetical protein